MRESTGLPPGQRFRAKLSRPGSPIRPGSGKHLVIVRVDSTDFGTDVSAQDFDRDTQWPSDDR